jgi:hypothetical protein
VRCADLQSIFGMNVGGMGAENPSWALFFQITIPGTFGSMIILLALKWLWSNRSWGPLATFKGGAPPNELKKGKESGVGKFKPWASPTLPEPEGV